MKAGWAKYAYFSRLASIGLLFVVVSTVSFFPIKTHAFSLSSFVGSFFGSDKALEADISVRSDAQTSQNMALLDAMGVADLATGGGDVLVVEEKYLSAGDMGMNGTITEIEDRYRQGKASIYVVRSGETITQIAKLFNVSTNTIRWANDISEGAKLKEGQHLVILPVDGVQHTVKSKDTLSSLAKEYKADIDEIREFNEIAIGQKLVIGEILIIPGGKETPVSSSVTTKNRAETTSYPAYGSYYSHPVPTGHKTQGLHGYNGIDYGASVGAPVYSAAEGTVIVSKFTSGYCGRYCGGGYGNYIVIAHPNGTQTLYGHLSAVYTQVGVRVGQGQWIGEVGSTGKSTGPHLHFEVRGAKNPGTNGSWAKSLSQ